MSIAVCTKQTLLKVKATGNFMRRDENINIVLVKRCFTDSDWDSGEYSPESVNANVIHVCLYACKKHEDAQEACGNMVHTN